MTKKEVEGFLSEPFFVALKPKEKPDPEVVSITFEESFKRDYDHYYLYTCLLDSYYKYNMLKREDWYQFGKDYDSIVKQVVLNYLVQEDVLKYFCLDNEIKKAVELIKRSQINAGTLLPVLNRISYVLCNLNINKDNFALILNNDLKRRILDFNEKFIIKNMKSFKDKIDKVASGVKQECYIDFYNRRANYRLSNEFVSYVKDKHGYDLDNHEYYREKYTLVKILSLAVENQDKLWDFENRENTLLSFIAYVERYNDIKHAEKIIDFAFQEACKDEKVKFLYDNKLPFKLYDIEDQMLNWCFNRLDVYLSRAVEFKIKQEEKDGFLYPIHQGYEAEIKKGKDIFESFLRKLYPNDYDNISNIFNDLNYVVQERRMINSNITRKELTIGDVLEYHLLGYGDQQDAIKYLSLKYKDYLKPESIKMRFYYRIYIIDEYAKDVSSECIYEYIYEILRMIEEKNHIKSSYIIDTTFRDENYNRLKGILADYDLNIDDKFKPEYIIALLDRKYATVEEASRFAELEQFGDAIYELAVDNIIFYDPENKMDLDHSNIEEYVKADAQIKVSKYIGLDKAYISKFNGALNKKYAFSEVYDSGLNHTYEGHYLADSLEMVIGVIAKEFGVQKALDFATRIIVEANEELTKPVIFGSFDPVYLYNESNAELDYLNKIYPAPFSSDSYNSDYFNIRLTLNKLLKITILGNDTVEKRKLITNAFDKLIPDTSYDGYQEVIHYLYYGIEKTIEKYEAIVKSSYSKKI